MRSPLQILASQPQVGRRWRRPVHSWNTRYLPFQMQPVVLAPVLPGETLKNAMFQMRTVSDPIKNRLIGWWHEFYLYYVPMLAMGDDDFDEKIKSMLIDPTFDLDESGLASSTPQPDMGFNGRGQINWTKLALDAVVAAEFRNENELHHSFEINGLPIASVQNRNWTDSVLADSEMATLDVDDVDANQDGVISASEIDQAMAQYEVLKMHGLVDMSYEDYLKTFGIRGQAVREDKGPEVELIRYKRDFSYPANTADAVGNVGSVLSWSTADRADKDRFFRHPGFLIGIEVARPKVYMSGLTGQAAHAMLSLADWLPAVLRDDPLSSLKKFDVGQGPLAGPVGTPSEGYWVDMRDLFLYGDQFTNSGVALTAGIPRQDLERRFVVLQEVLDLFAAEDGKGVAKDAPNHIESDGIINFSILGAETDHTAQRSRIEPDEEE